ncbi:hypothetical protein J7E93_14130 [Streptomyces sp. ISL-36]|uniref:hypothetical protein n=1 Tax=Streptomyces sp. ISL-36 TaxID=2819182 RepID=UPI001BEA9310|nr:hypothetical protein [Streptomyces sp. ISL-36]MBT2441230.1 hypothetical protein [Streptomyces sp. ISL-36]
MGPSPRSTARTALRAVLAVGVLAGLPGCADDARTPGHDAAPRAVIAVDICTDLVAYWAKEALTGSRWAGLDWEQKGLSNEQLAIHDEVLAAARTRERADGREAALAGIDRETRRRCAAASGATGSSENWRPPPGPSTSPSARNTP